MAKDEEKLQKIEEREETRRRKAAKKTRGNACMP
jgi:hypothetical protein